ncbi:MULTISPECIES: glutamine-hydrolyzing carbamoyl-phosphate synthase small subunit [Persicobacter]|uniref:Carbamoyl phosphate synthase small chain n=1 Tax=Persicobacter diffluens TaxID=981 RepID=A0AAN5AKP8_9BACT|nr:glutamine-hydrolyzing carbamoyl-phosphate synthase small subunit [Persicobacter sp. CCB-QB2]GJM62037.1 carbamoyl-phosphate synthase small chain [Persicobacter diffluens]
MKYTYKSEAVLMLEDGTVFHGRAIGKIGTKGGEICFNTGMTGYQEVYTDPSYFGQIIVTTNSHIGNYGVHENESEGLNPSIFGVVINTFSDIYSRKEAESSLQDYLELHGIVGIADIDTRKLVRHIRSKGAMNAIISSEIHDYEVLRAQLKEVPSMKGLELSSQVCVKEPVIRKAENVETKKRVAVLDLGIKESILRHMESRGMECKLFPSTTPYEELKAWGADGYFISNGPGDPAAMDYAVDTVKQIIADDQPLFGICMGHQILARATGISTYKMHSGHRGLNHPVKNLLTGRCEVTSQNHGFAVSAEEVEKSGNVEVTHINLNDNTVEGIRVKDKKAFSVQYHPESSPGPHDSHYLFEDFLSLMDN